MLQIVIVSIFEDTDYSVMTTAYAITFKRPLRIKNT